MKIFIYLIFVFTTSLAGAQTCEKLDRKLFHLLPKEVPDSINCKDASGQKQGWWIYYKVEYNPIAKPDELAAGNYVHDYYFGKYKDGRKIDKWRQINNVHLIYEISSDSHIYNSDTLFVKTKDGMGEFTFKYVGDSAIRAYQKLNSN